MVERTVAVGQTHPHDSSAAESSVAGEPGWTGAHWLVRYHIAHGVCAARRWSVAQVLAAVQKTGLFVGTVVVSATSDLTAPVGADLSRQTLFIGGAAQKASFVRTHFS